MKFNFKGREVHPHHHHINFLLVMTIFLIIIIAVLINPALLGYRISKQIEDIGIKPAEFLRSTDTLKSKLLVAETNLETCKSSNSNFLSELSAEKNASFKCSQEKSALQSELTFNMSRVKSEFDQRSNEIEAELNRNSLVVNETKENYNRLLENSVNNICCKAKVDDKRIDSYIVSGNAIVCTSGEENKISC